MTVDDKPQVVVCFDTTGSGKTTTIREASQRVNASRVIISPKFSTVLCKALSSCAMIGDQLGLDSASAPSQNTVVTKMQFKFNSALETLLSHITSLIQQAGETVFETRLVEGNVPDVSQLEQPCMDSFTQLCRTLGDRPYRRLPAFFRRGCTYKYTQ